MSQAKEENLDYLVALDILNELMVPIIIVRAKGNKWISFANKEAEAFTGYTGSVLAGQTFDHLLQEKDRERFEDFCAIAALHIASQDEFTLMRRSGRPLKILIKAKLIDDGNLLLMVLQETLTSSSSP